MNMEMLAQNCRSVDNYSNSVNKVIKFIANVKKINGNILLELNKSRK